MSDCYNHLCNQQFYSVFTRDNKNITAISSSKYPSMANIEFATQGIVKLLLDLKPGKSARPYNLPTRIFKEYALQIAPVIQVIFTYSGILPNDRVTANIVPNLPIYKKRDKSNPVNYRPISLTSVCCKITEHVSCHFILDHLSAHNIINPIQHGFRSGLSS